MAVIPFSDIRDPIRMAAPAAPVPVIDLALRRAINDLLRLTAVYRHEQVLDWAAGEARHELTIPTGMRLDTVESVTDLSTGTRLARSTEQSIEAREPKWRTANDAPWAFADTAGNRVIIVGVAQATEVGRFLVKARLKLSIRANSIEEDLFEDYHEAIVYKAIDHLHEPHYEWFDAGVKNMYMALAAAEFARARRDADGELGFVAETARYGGV